MMSVNHILNHILNMWCPKCKTKDKDISTYQIQIINLEEDNKQYQFEHDRLQNKIKLLRIKYENKCIQIEKLKKCINGTN